MRARTVLTNLPQSNRAKVDQALGYLLQTISNESSTFSETAAMHLNCANQIYMKTQEALNKKKILPEDMPLVFDYITSTEQLCRNTKDIKAQQNFCATMEKLKGKPHLWSILGGISLAIIGAVIIVASVAAIAVSFGLLSPPALLSVAVGTCAVAKGISIVCLAIGTCVLAKGLRTFAQNVKHSIPKYVQSGLTFWERLSTYNKGSATTSKKSADILIPATNKLKIT